jgi:hypothetical protein
MNFWAGFIIGFVVSTLVGTLGLAYYLRRTWQA